MGKEALVAEAVREAIVKTGLGLEDKVLAVMPRDLKYTAIQIRSIIESYKNTDILTISNNLLNIKNIDEIIKYITILAYLIGYSRAKAEDILEAYPREYESLDGLSAGKLRQFIEKILNNKIDNINNHVNNIIKILNFLKDRKGMYIWILKQRRVEEFEDEIRRYIFQNDGGYSIDRGVKLFLRLFIDKNSIPLAYKIAYNEREVRRYRIHGDIYTTLVTLRSGAFEDMRSTTVDKIRQRVAKALICRERGERCKNIRIRLRSVRGLVRSVAYLSGDPIAYERGAYHVGRNYCARLKCDECPIRDVCKKYIFINIK